MELPFNKNKDLNKEALGAFKIKPHWRNRLLFYKSYLRSRSRYPPTSDANMSDSSRISPSRCPKNATWIGKSESPISNFSDKTYPEEVDRLSEEEDQLIVDACWSNNSLAAAVGLLFRRLRGRIFNIENVGRHRDEEQSSVYDSNHALAERVSSLATTNCTMWVELA